MADETMTDEQILEGVEHKSFVATSDRTAASLSKGLLMRRRYASSARYCWITP